MPSLKITRKGEPEFEEGVKETIKVHERLGHKDAIAKLQTWKVCVEIVDLPSECGTIQGHYGMTLEEARSGLLEDVLEHLELWGNAVNALAKAAVLLHS